MRSSPRDHSEWFHTLEHFARTCDVSAMCLIVECGEWMSQFDDCSAESVREMEQESASFVIGRVLSGRLACLLRVYRVLY